MLIADLRDVKFVRCLGCQYENCDDIKECLCQIDAFESLLTWIDRQQLKNKDIDNVSPCGK
jgi:hypothetical protein